MSLVLLDVRNRIRLGINQW